MKRLALPLLWIAAFSPALICFLLFYPMRQPTPIQDTWAYVEDYERFLSPDYSWRNFLAPHCEHPVASGKAIFFAVMKWLGGDLTWLPIIGWFFSVIISFCLLVLSRPIWQGKPRTGAALWFLANLSIFTTAMASTWIWEFTYQNFIPGACLTLMLVVLTRDRWPLWLRLALVAPLCVVATFGFASGFLAGLLMLWVLWGRLQERPIWKRLLICGCFMLAQLALAWLALRAFSIYETGASTPRGFGDRIMAIRDDPGLMAQSIALLLGYQFAHGTAFDPAHIGTGVGSLLIVLMVWCAWRCLRARKDEPFQRMAAPWICLTTWGLVSALLIFWGRFGKSIIPAFASRYIVLTLFFTVGLIYLLAIIHKKHPFRPPWCVAGLVLLCMLHALNWKSGHNEMRRVAMEFNRERAALCFVRVLPMTEHPAFQAVGGTEFVRKLSRFLQEENLLKRVRFFESAKTSDYKINSPLNEKRWSAQVAKNTADGSWQFSGFCTMAKRLNQSQPDLLLLALAPKDHPAEEKLVAVHGETRIPDDYFNYEWLRSRYLNHYNGWSFTLRADQYDPETMNYRVFAFDFETQRLHPLELRKPMQNE